MINTVRPPAVAGMFYPGHPATLAATVDQLIAEAEALLTRLSTRFPEAPLVWLNLGNVLRDTGRLVNRDRSASRAASWTRSCSIRGD